MREFMYFLNNWGFWSWLSIGALLMIAELFIPGTFIMWFGFGAILTGIIVLIASEISIVMQFFTFVIT